MKRILSGIKPSGTLTLGNYIGAISKFVELQKKRPEDEFYLFVADLHAITIPQETALLRKRTRDVAAMYLAAGIDPERTVLFIQSEIKEHAELGYLLQCFTYIGELERMTQFKDKSKKGETGLSSAFFSYPALMAADIILYDADYVPVGEDQKQHLELSRDIADRFNREYGVPGFFPLPEPMIKGPGARIMSLKDGTKKMSKSDPSDLSRITLVDDADAISKKIKKATTDTGVIPATAEELKGRPEVENLVGIYAALSGRTVESVLAEFEGKGFGAFKPALADVTVAHMAPITTRFCEILADPAGIDRVLANGAERANAVAAPIMDEVRRVVGFWRP
ncbi:MAG: tryptophan--tRNA ligase [Bacillota bacterium]|nr:tryptophan--tRNA ligase [Bacillota bacterium]